LNYYFVAKSPDGDYIGQLTLEDIDQRLSTRKLSSGYVATRSLGGNYDELMKSGTAIWVTLAELVANPAMPGSAVVPASGQVAVLMRRYNDSYIVARETNKFGGIIKVIAIALAVLIILVGFIFISNNPSGNTAFTMIVLTIISGGITGLWFYIAGVIVAAQGQILKASLDSAVNNSPFLTNEQRANIMSLPEA
jgi:hypothetical protein